MSRTLNTAIVRCSCGSIELEATGAPIISAVCYCDDCQEGSRRIEALPHAPPARDPDGGTSYVLYRKDRLRCTQGAALLKRQKLSETSATNRVVATCCNAAMYIDFDDSKFWVSVYRHRFQGDAPPVQMRIQTKFKPGTGDVPRDVRSYRTYPLRFIGKLIAAKIAMTLRR